MSRIFDVCKRCKGSVGVLVMLAALSTAHAQGMSIKQTIAIPAYFTPGAYWSQLDTSTPYVGIAVANVLNGPDYQVDSSYTSAIQAAQSAGIKVLGYVNTGYFGTTGQTTRLGASDTNSWLSEIEQDVDAWYSFYGSSGLTGIFFDQTQNTCGSGNAYANLYAQIYAYVKQNYPGALVIDNPGTAVPRCFQDTADVLLTFEGSYLCYIQDPSCPQGDAYVALGWNPVDPRKIWHIVYGTTAAQLESAAALSKSEGAGYIDITSYGLPNPYDVLPTGSYWTALEAASLSADTTDHTPPGTPTGLASWDVSYTSATLSWRSSTDPRSRLVAYDIYQDGTWLESVPAVRAETQSVTLTGLKPDTTYAYTLVARDAVGNISSASRAHNLTTKLNKNIPAAPGNVQALDVTYTSGTLSWSPSSGAKPGANGIAFYDIYNAGTHTKVLTVTAATSSIVVGGLTPGSNNAFTVSARDNAGSVSPASAQVTIATTPLPGGLEISDPAGTYTTTAMSYTADYLLPFALQHVFIDTDNNAGTGWITSSSPGPAIGADYMIEGAYLYKYLGSGTDWSWAYVGPVTPSVSGYAVTWSVPLTDFSSPLLSTATVQFEGDGGAPTGNSVPVVLTQN